MFKTNLFNYVAIAILTAVLVYGIINFNEICDAVTRTFQL